MNIKINKQNNVVIINDVLILPIDDKISIEFEKETLNSCAISDGKIGDGARDFLDGNQPLDTIPCTTTDNLVGHGVTTNRLADTSCDFNRKLNHKYVPNKLPTE